MQTTEARTSRGSIGTRRNILLAIFMPSLFAVVSILGIGGTNATSLALGAAIIVFAATSFFWLHSQQSPPSETESSVVTAADGALEQLVGESLPIWSRHIDRSNRYVEESVSGLMQQFSYLIDSLDQSVSASSATGGSDHVIGTLSSSQTDLSDVVSALRHAHQSRQQMLEELGLLKTFTSELQDLATDVASIADHAEQLAHDAGKESARAVEGGKGFSVVEGEIRELSARSRETASQMTERMTSIKKSIDSTVESAEAMLTESGEQLAETEQRLDHVITKSGEVIDQLQQSSRNLREDADGVSRVIEQLIVELQFQDRVSQVLTQVSHNLRELEREISEAQDPDGHIRKLDVDADAWLAKMQASYTMIDQHRTHRGEDRQESKDSEVEFF